MSAIMDPPGNFAIAVDSEGVKQRLRRAESGIDDWLYELTDRIAFQASERLRIHAPGNIPLFVDVDLAHETGPGHFEATAGVTPDPTNLKPISRRGSDPADYPIFVDQGTGIYGVTRSPIYAVPGHLMGPISYRGRDIYVHSVEGQPAQHFSREAFVDTVAVTPARIELAMPELRRKIYGL